MRSVFSGMAIALGCMLMTGMVFGKSSSSVTLASSLNPSNYGTAVTFTATVTPATATGTVTFKDGSTTLGTGTLSGGTATYSTSKLAVGSHSVTARYGGDANDNPSVSPTLTQLVNQATTTVTLKSSANPSAYGSSVTFTATVTPSAATGTVTFTDGSTTLGTGTLSRGIATYSTSALAVGPHSITASYGGDANDSAGVSQALTQTVNPANTKVALTSSANPSVYGSLVTFTATVTPSAATGTVTFTDGSTTLGTGTLSGGIATYSTSTLAVGTHSITAAYGGDGNDNPSTSSTVTQKVSKASSTVALSSSLNPSNYGTSVTFTATVTPSVATGTVTFKDGTATLGTGTLSGGIATYSTSTLAVKSHSITAAYGGDANDNASTSAALTQVVNQANTTVTLTSSANPSAVGASVTFTATVTPATATGTVTFTDGSTTLGTGKLSSGTATYSTSKLALGSHSITAAYGGDTNDSASVSPTLTQTVIQSNTTVTLTSSLNPSGYGSLVTFKATVTPSAATGTITFADGNTTLGTGTLSGGIATYTTSALALGTHSITASYGGDGNYGPGVSSPLTQTVTQANSSVALSSSANPSSYGAPVTFTATVTPSTATGTVTFMSGKTTLGTSTLSGGIATYSTTALPVGGNTITASYGGDANDSAANSPTLTQTVNQASVTVTLASTPNPSAYGSLVTFTATVTTPADGTVTFTDGSTKLGTVAIVGGIATYSSSALAVGSHPITATYNGNIDYAISSSPTQAQTVNQASTTVTLASSANPSAYGSVGCVHGDGDAFDGNGNCNLRRRQHDAGNGHDQRRHCNLQHLNAGGGAALDHGFLRRGHKRRHQRFSRR